MADTLILRGTLRSHTGWVTAIACPIDNSDTIVTSSRDKSLIVWHLINNSDKTFGVVHRRLTGHSHFIQDVAVSSNGKVAVSGSCDSELRLWDLTTGLNLLRLVGHNSDVLSVAFSTDNRIIFSASRDKTIKLWNLLGECQWTIENGHDDWVSCVRFIPDITGPTIVSGSWDKSVKIWNLSNCKVRNSLYGHKEYVKTVAVSPDGSLCASGGKEGKIFLWDLSNEGKMLRLLDSGSIVNALCFSPNRYWLCAATKNSIQVWDLDSKKVIVDLKADDLKEEPEMATTYCTSLCWSADGSTLFSGYTDGVVRIWGVESNNNRCDVDNLTSCDGWEMCDIDGDEWDMCDVENLSSCEG